MNGAAFDPATGTLHAASVSKGQLVRIDPVRVTGEGVGSYAYVSINGMAYHPVSRRLYVLNRSGRELVWIDPGTGLGRVIGSTGVPGLEGLALALDEFGVTTLYANRYGQVYSVDPWTAIATPMTTSWEATLHGLSFEPIAGQLYGISASDLVRLDPRGSTSVGPTGLANLLSLTFVTDDCNGNGIADACDIAKTSNDRDGNGVPDECDRVAFIGDVNRDGYINLNDYAAFARCPAMPLGGLDLECAFADLDLDYDVDLIDWSLYQAAFTNE
jgi:hypothetical protein